MRIGFIGCGKMGGALLRGIVGAGVCAPDAITVTDVVPEALDALRAETGVRVAADAAAVAAAADIVVLCVKPGDAAAAIAQAGSALAGRLLVSVAAGIPIAALEAAAGPRVRVIRVMPNTPALVGRGIAAYAAGSTATEADTAAVAAMFDAVGGSLAVRESLMDAVTGLSGSGPAFVYMVIEALADGGVLSGLSREQALRLAAQTVAGAAEMVIRTGMHPAALRDQVASPGGTTIAGIAALEEAGLRNALIGAVRAAAARSRELAG